MRRVYAMCAILLFVPALAFAQKPVNPRTVIFNQDPVDYPAIVRFEVAYFLPGAAQPTSNPINIGKPLQDSVFCPAPSTTPCITASVNTQPIPFGFDYVAKVRAVAVSGTTELFSEWSDASNPFDRLPGKPGVPVVR